MAGNQKDRFFLSIHPWTDNPQRVGLREVLEQRSPWKVERGGTRARTKHSQRHNRATPAGASRVVFPLGIGDMGRMETWAPVGSSFR